MTIDPAIIEAAARALRKEPILFDYPDECLELARAVLTAVTPLIRNAALEKAANAATGYFLFRSEDTEDVYHVCEAIAARIRFLKEQP